MSNHNEISSFIWNVCDDVLRGLFKQHEYGDVILPFLVLRRLDCLINPDHSEFEILVSDPKNLKENIGKYIEDSSDQICEILDGFEFDKTIDLLTRNQKLITIVRTFSELDLNLELVDNHTMGSIFEEFLRKFSEMSNERGGEHYTPRDVVQLIVSLVLSGEENLGDKGLVKSLYDPCCGTGGMLSFSQEWIYENESTNFSFNLIGQEINSHSHSICKSYMLMLGKDPDKIRLGSTMSNDQFQGQKFDYMITNPPFGMNWRSEKDFIEQEMKYEGGRFSIGVPRTSDGSFLFLQHMISKMKPEGSRIGVLFNGSPHFSGDSGSGESEIRRWILENDWLECIVSLPDQLYYNTGISTYLWVLTNQKTSKRKGKVQLIDGSSMFNLMERSIGNKRKLISHDHIQVITQIHNDFEDSEFSLIENNELFGYTKVVIEQPSKENGKIVLSDQGRPIPDPNKRDVERIPLYKDIDDFFKKEVKPYLPESWMDREKDKVGYEIDIKRVFSDNRHEILKKSFPSSEWIRLKYLGSFVDESNTSCLLIKEIKGLSEIDLVIPFNDSSQIDKKRLKRYKSFQFSDTRIDPVTLSGYLNSKYGVNDVLGLYNGSVIERLSVQSFQNLSVPILDENTIKFFNLNTDLIQRIENELKTIEQEVVYQFNSENSDNLYQKLFNILNSTNQLVKEDEIKNMIRKGENYFVEFKETFHSNVKNNYQKDEKMRHSCLKTICGFLNSRGGNLLVGVHDHQYVTGIEQDQFKDNDKYLLTIKDLIKSRLGGNSHMFLNYDIYKVDGKRVLLVECDKSTEPFYLDGEHFYVRVNPSTEELKGTEMYKYVTKNFKNN